MTFQWECPVNNAARTLSERLINESIVQLDADKWMVVADQFEELERHSTSISGDLLIVRLESVFAVVEQPTPDTRVVRQLADRDEAHRFVEQRLQEYDRMWDGCGCKIDYYS